MVALDRLPTGSVCAAAGFAAAAARAASGRHASAGASRAGSHLPCVSLLYLLVQRMVLQCQLLMQIIAAACAAAAAAAAAARHAAAGASRTGSRLPLVWFPNLLAQRMVLQCQLPTQGIGFFVVHGQLLAVLPAEGVLLKL